MCAWAPARASLTDHSGISRRDSTRSSETPRGPSAGDAPQPTRPRFDLDRVHHPESRLAMRMKRNLGDLETASIGGDSTLESHGYPPPLGSGAHLACFKFNRHSHGNEPPGRCAYATRRRNEAGAFSLPRRTEKWPERARPKCSATSARRATSFIG